MSLLEPGPSTISPAPPAFHMDSGACPRKSPGTSPLNPLNPEAPLQRERGSYFASQCLEKI